MAARDLPEVTRQVIAPKDITEVALPGERWEELGESNAVFGLVWGRRIQTVWSIPLDVQRTPVEDIAGGRYDEQWATFGRLARGDSGSAVVRIVLPARADPRTSAAAFRRAATAVRRTPGVAVEWGLPAGADPRIFEAAWPGDDVVDLVGVDVRPHVPWAAEVAGPGGLSDWSTWSRGHGKRLGVHWRLDDGSDPEAVRLTASWLDMSARTSRVAYDSVSADPQVSTATLSTYRRLW